MVSEADVSERLSKLSPIHIEVEDESDGCGAKFRILVVSDVFNGKRVLECHRMVQDAISDIMPQIHAVTIHALTEAKWAASNSKADDSEEMLDEFGDPIGSYQNDIDSSISNRFHSAANFLPSIMTELDRPQLMRFYALYKQATAGPADSKDRPSMLDVKGRSKFVAWESLGKMPKQVAMTTYATEMENLHLGWEYNRAQSTQGYGFRPSRPAPASTSGSDDDLLVQDRETTLWFAASKADDVDTMRRLLSYRPALVLERDQHLGMTALHWAIDSGCDGVVSFLLQNGAEVDAVDPEGNTPLHFAACCHRTSAAELLLSKGANTSLRNEEGKTASESCMDEPNLQSLLSGYS